MVFVFLSFLPVERLDYFLGLKEYRENNYLFPAHEINTIHVRSHRHSRDVYGAHKNVVE